MLSSFPEAAFLLADRGYDAEWFRYALKSKGITPCIPGRKSREKPVKYDQRRYRRRSRIEMMFGRLKIGGASLPDTTDVPKYSSTP